MFNINDTVIYSGNGVCVIQAIEERDFGGEVKLYYILKPIYNNKSTIYVPTDNLRLTSKLKKVLTKQQVDDIIKTIPEHDIEWIQDADKRREYYKEISNEGNRGKILAVIRCIHNKQVSKNKKEKKPHIFDVQFMHENERVILEEFAIALGIEPKAVEEYIEAILKSI